MLHEISAQRTVCISRDGVFGDANGGSKHASMRKDAFVGISQCEGIEAVAADISTEEG